MTEIEVGNVTRYCKPYCGIFHDANDLLISKLLAKCVRNNYLVKDIADSEI